MLRRYLSSGAKPALSRNYESSALRLHQKSVVFEPDGEEEYPLGRNADELDYSTRSLLCEHLLEHGRLHNRQIRELPLWARQSWVELSKLRSNAQL